MYSTKDFTLKLHKQAFEGVAQDFVIRFNNVETCIHQILAISSDAVTELIDHYHEKGKIIKGHLVARVIYTTVDRAEAIVYYHPSYGMERIRDPLDFYTRHMGKIASRMDNFNRNGSALLINRIDAVHLKFTVLN